MVRRWLLLAIMVAAFTLLIANAEWWQTGLKFLFPGEAQVLHPRSLLVLVSEHIRLVAISSVLTVIIGVPLGIWVTQPGGRNFLPIVTDIASFGQTFPPVAVLALSVPMLGFGLLPTVVALFLYGLLPVVRNTIAGLRSVPRDVLDAANGMGMSRAQALARVQIPLAAPVILAGLVQDNTAYIIEGAAPAAMLAILADQLMANIEASFTYRTNWA